MVIRAQRQGPTHHVLFLENIFVCVELNAIFIMSAIIDFRVLDSHTKLA